MIKGLGVLQRDVSVRYDKLVDVSGLYSHTDLHRLLSTKPLGDERNRGIFTTAGIAFARTYDMITGVRVNGYRSVTCRSTADMGIQCTLRLLPSWG